MNIKPKVISADTLGCPFCDKFNHQYAAIKKKPTLRQWKTHFEYVALKKHIAEIHPEKDL